MPHTGGNSPLAAVATYWFPRSPSHGDEDSAYVPRQKIAAFAAESRAPTHNGCKQDYPGGGISRLRCGDHGLIGWTLVSAPMRPAAVAFALLGAAVAAACGRGDDPPPV